jgi:iron complex outermembrane receptor protein
MLTLERRTIYLFFIFISLNFAGLAQEIPDTSQVKPLEEVIIRSFEQNRRLKDVPASVNYLNRSGFDRFGAASVVSAVNTTPGVRMEERSPGSYRFNIRGSALRSPFGVRNVKVYYNDIPITDPGGQTYLNQLGSYNFNSLEVIKGPGSSLYGAGTGGVLQIQSLDSNEQAGIASEYTAASYGGSNFYVSLSTGSNKLVARGSYQHQLSDGYRDHSSLKRDVHTWTGIFHMNKDKLLQVSFLYGDLFYETPGALTKAEYEKNPRAARPAVGGFPSAEAAKASVRQRSFMTGLSYFQHFAPKWDNKSVLYGMFTELRNPTIRNYGKNSEPHIGGRTMFRFTQPFVNGNFLWDLGAEWQEGFASVMVHKNVAGNADSLQSYDDIHNRQQFAFTQLTLDYHSWSLTAGGSWNMMKIRFQRFLPYSLGIQSRKFDNQLAPRVALMKKLGIVNIYSSVSKGFSPPTTAELLPSGSMINLVLEPEEGINYDLGARGTLFRKLYVDVNAFIYSLQNTIVQRRDVGGGDFYVNAGKTKQHGIESYFSFPFLNAVPSMNKSQLWLSHTWHDFHYKEFKQLANDFSGKQLPGEAPHTVAAGIDFLANKGWMVSVNYFYSDRIPLNDGNTEFANSYNLLGARLAWQKWVNVFRFKLAAGVDNLLDEQYSLGNDINAAGGRYYNAAPGRNYYVSFMIQWASKKILQ